MIEKAGWAATAVGAALIAAGVWLLLPPLTAPVVGLPGPEEVATIRRQLPAPLALPTATPVQPTPAPGARLLRVGTGTLAGERHDRQALAWSALAARAGDLQVEVVPTATGADGLRRLQRGELDAALASGADLHDALGGLNAWRERPFREARLLWVAEAESWRLLTPGAGVRLSELRGRVIYGGPPGSLAERTTREALRALDVSVGRFDGDLAGALAGLGSGSVGAVAWLGKPAGKVAERPDLREVELTEDQRQALGRSVAWLRLVEQPVSTGSGGGQVEVVVPFGVAVRADLPEAEAARLVRLAIGSSAGPASDLTSGSGDLAGRSLRLAPIPLHPGAALALQPGGRGAGGPGSRGAGENGNPPGSPAPRLLDRLGVEG